MCLLGVSHSDVNKDWTCKDKDKDQARKDQDKDKDCLLSCNPLELIVQLVVLLNRDWRKRYIEGGHSRR